MALEAGGGSSGGSDSGITASDYVTDGGYLRVGAMMATAFTAFIQLYTAGVSWTVARVFAGLSTAVETVYGAAHDLMQLPFELHTDLWIESWQIAAVSLEGFGILAWFVGIGVILFVAYAGERLFTGLLGGVLNE